MNKIFKPQSGFTIVELLLYMGIFSILLVILLELFGTILSTHAESQATSAVDQDGSYAMARLVYDIHRSSTLSVSGSILTLTISGASDTYQIKTINGNNYLVFTDATGDTVLNSVGTSAAVTFTTYGNPVSTPSCTPNCKPSVQIVLTLAPTTKRPGGALQTQTFTTTVDTR